MTEITCSYCDQPPVSGRGPSTGATIRLCEKHQKMTPDTKPVEGLGEATVKREDWPSPDHCPHCESFDACKVSESSLLFHRLLTERDAVNQRVKVLEVGFRNILNVLGPNVPSDLKGCPGCQEEWAEAIRIASEALDLQCGNCGDDGEEPSRNCPTCHGTGFAREALNEGGTRK